MKNKKLLRVWTCQKCQHQWANRKSREPKACPACRSVNWNED